MEDRHINFEVFKSSYLEKHLKIEDLDECIKKKRNDKNKEIMEIISQGDSLKRLYSNNDDKNDHDIINDDKKENVSIKNRIDHMNINTSDLPLKNEKNKNIFFKKYNSLHIDHTDTKKKINEFLKKYKDTYNIFKEKKLPLCNNIDELFHNNYNNDKEQNSHNQLSSPKKYNNNIKSIIQLNEQNKKYDVDNINNFIQKNIIKNNSLGMQKILYNIKSTFNDFIDVYMEKPNTDIDFLYNKIYEEKKKKKNNYNNNNNNYYNHNNNDEISKHIYECNILKDVNPKGRDVKEINKIKKIKDQFGCSKNEPYEYINMISEYMNNNNNNNNRSFIKEGYHTNKKDTDSTKEKIKEEKDEVLLNYELEENSNDEIIDTQTNDKNVVDVSVLTHKYKYRSNIIFTINKIKNLESIIEINISITDIKLKIPGMRIENIILPYKYNNDILRIEIKTLKNKLIHNNKLNKHIYKNKNEYNFNSSCSDNLCPTKKDSKAKIICYYAFIPLCNIKDQIINKKLILIKSKNKEIYEKEKLLPETLYLIQSKDITSSQEKYFYISIKKCIHGIHYYPNNINDEKDNIQHNYFTPIYVSLYNDNVDNYIAHIINQNNYVEKIKIQKIIENETKNYNDHNINISQGSYIINNMYFKFFFNHNKELVCNNQNHTKTNNTNQHKAVDIFHFLCNNYISIKCPLDLIPLYILPPYQDLQYLDFIGNNKFLKLKFILHLLSIMENICIHICSLMNIKINTSPIFNDHLKSVEIKDEQNRKNYFTFMYTSYMPNEQGAVISAEHINENNNKKNNDDNNKKNNDDDDNNNNNNDDDDNNNNNNNIICGDEDKKNYFVNYIKPFIFRFQNVDKNDIPNNLRNINKYMYNKINNNDHYDYTNFYGEDSISIHQDLQKNHVKNDKFHMEKINDNDLFIYEYAKKQALFIYNIIKDYDDIINIHKFYDQEKNILYTTNYNKHSFQNFYMHIIDEYNKIINQTCISKQQIYINQYDKKRENDISFFNNTHNTKDNILSIQHNNNNNNVKENITNNNFLSSNYDNLENYNKSYNILNLSKKELNNNVTCTKCKIKDIGNVHCKDNNFLDFFNKDEENNNSDNNKNDIHMDDLDKYIQHNNPSSPHYFISSKNRDKEPQDKTHIHYLNNKKNEKINVHIDMCDHTNSKYNPLNSKENNSMKKEINKNLVEYKDNFSTSSKKCYEANYINKNFSFSPEYFEETNECINENSKQNNNRNKENIQLFQDDNKKEKNYEEYNKINEKLDNNPIYKTKEKNRNNNNKKNNNSNNLSYMYGQTNINNKKNIILKDGTKDNVNKFNDDNYNNRKKTCNLIKSNIYKM
ncbi:hypothetical protein PFMG_02877 [Plasmodium falciparum IGH-CR14]|uniref:Uncharacterized protein n=1 Tax=Plasmodium falciparum IGH-CR14 TaxID=580059 RepID=A0A0L1IBX8_PLAFA|nr:hypothetical protein PFMG_02877 [Plasmodium falciparum IGH-CR14]